MGEAGHAGRDRRPAAVPRTDEKALENGLTKKGGPHILNSIDFKEIQVKQAKGLERKRVGLNPASERERHRLEAFPARAAEDASGS